MTDIRELLLELVAVFVALVVVGGGGAIVVSFAESMLPLEGRKSQTEINFRSACAEVKGRTVWNGRNWECIK